MPQSPRKASKREKQGKIDWENRGVVLEGGRKCGKTTRSANLKNSMGWTPLHWAACEGHVDIAQQLLQRGADINTADDEGWIALHFYCCERIGGPAVVAEQGGYRR